MIVKPDQAQGSDSFWLFCRASVSFKLLREPVFLTFAASNKSIKTAEIWMLQPDLKENFP